MTTIEQDTIPFRPSAVSLSRARVDYISHLGTRRRLHRRTLRRYDRSLQMLGEFLSRQGWPQNMVSIRPVQLRAFVEHVECSTPGMARTHYYTLRGFFLRAEEMGLIESNPMRKVDVPLARATPASPLQTLTDQDLRRIISSRGSRHSSLCDMTASVRSGVACAWLRNSWSVNGT